jgi:hypothetical protein
MVEEEEIISGIQTLLVAFHSVFYGHLNKILDIYLD